ncbi:MAG: hypothetical protein U5Q03_08390 [Bacteroidota bacterium]|nr:hypothetical protein [Bacteroidota bacterium]
MKKIYLISVFLLLVSAGFSQAKIKRGCHSIRVFRQTENGDIFPRQWQQMPVNAYSSILPDSLAEKNLNILSDELDKYPLTLFRKLKRVYVFDSLAFFNKAFGGTYFKRNIYYTDRGFTENDIARKIHHEFSSILLKRYWHKFDQKEWKKLLPAAFQYKSKGVDALMTSDANLNFIDSLNAAGFLNPYSLYHLEEDFNSFAQHLWSGDPGFWQRIDHYPALRAKLEQVIAFYCKLSPELNEAFFRKLIQE